MIHLMTVCTENICSSPFAERMLQSELEAARPGQFAVASAGMQARDGEGMEEESATLLASFGGNSSNFFSRKLATEMLEQATVVLAMTAGQRDSIIRTSPRMVNRTYTLIEFARIVRSIRLDKSPLAVRGSDAGAVEERWEKLPALAASYRSASQPSEAGDDAVDPLRSSNNNTEVHHRMAEDILPAVEEILAFESWCARQP